MRAIIGAMTGCVGPSLRERKKAQTRDAITAAALDLFERKGYDATTVDEIADAANVAPRTFFRYFDSKVEVVMEHKSDDRPDLGARLAERPATEGPVEAMCSVMREEFGQLVEENPLFVRQMRIMLTTATLHALARDHFNEHEKEIHVEVARRLDLPADDLRVHVITSALSNTIWTVVGLWVAEGSSPDRLRDMIDQSCRLLSAGLDSQPAS